MPRIKRAFTLVELMVALSIIAIMVVICAPGFERAIEQSRVDVAAANLRAIWAAQRLYWLEYHTYAGSGDPSKGIEQLLATGLLDSQITSSANRYTFSISSADSEQFSAAATRSGPGSGKWNGVFTINQNGDLEGELSADGESDITPAFQ
jgi:prepilin-type N-terminal cleavage/methylation domain-containing protein